MTYANHLAIHQALDAAPLLEERGLDSNELLVLICLARHMPRCIMSYAAIARECLMSRTTALTTVGNLKEKKLLTVTSGGGRSANVYLLNLDLSDVVGQTAHQCEPRTSVNYAPQQVEPRTAAVRGLDGSSTRFDHEVVNEVANETVKGVVNRSSSGEDEDDGSPTTTPVSLSDRRQARELADLYYEHLGSPHRLTIKLATDWPDAFGKLLTDHPAAELRAAIDWAFTIDTFWPPILKGIKRIDPVAYFVDKLPTILDAYAGTAAPKKPAQPSTPIPVDELALGHVKGFPQWKVE